MRGFNSGTAAYQFQEYHDWIGATIHYHLGVDGISLFLVLLTTFLTPLAILCSWQSIRENVKGFFIALLVIETAMIGVFVSLDLFLFFVFWELTLIPMYFMIGMWGHDRRIYAAVKFILYTMFGSILMLVAILWLYGKAGTFDLPEIQRLLQSGQIVFSPHTELLLFGAFFLAFAIKVPLFPLHTWLPDAHTEAPTAGSVILAGVMLKLGTYGILRFCLPLFPDAAHRMAPLIAVLAIIGIIYGALVATVQTDLKRLVAYTSVSHLGFVVLGIFAFNSISIQGAIYQMLSHGVSTGALFLGVGMLYDRRHTLEIKEFGGLGHADARAHVLLPVYFAFVARAAAAQRLHRRISDPDWNFRRPSRLGCMGRQRRGSVRDLSAVGLSARGPGRSHRREESQSVRRQRPRASHSRHHGRRHPLHGRRLSALHAPHGSLGEQRDAADFASAKRPAPRCTAVSRTPRKKSSPYRKQHCNAPSRRRHTLKGGCSA